MTATAPTRRRSPTPVPIRKSPAPSVAVPPLHPGDRLTRDEFLRRYDAMPEVKKAELIDGRVYMPSPVRNERHSYPHTLVCCWLVAYHAETPGTKTGDNGTLLLDETNIPQPDLFLRLGSEAGGQSRLSDDDYVDGAPELVVEVAASSAAYDLHEKRDTYRRHGVREYVVWRTEEDAIDWFALRDGRFVPLDAGGGRSPAQRSLPRPLVRPGGDAAAGDVDRAGGAGRRTGVRRTRRVRGPVGRASSLSGSGAAATGSVHRCRHLGVTANDASPAALTGDRLEARPYAVAERPCSPATRTCLPRRPQRPARFAGRRR